MIDMNHKYQTRDGRAVRILCVDGSNDLYPVVGFIDGQVWTFTWRADGKIGNGEAHADLIPVPTKHEMWFTFDEHFVIEKPCFETFGAARANAVRSGSNIAHVTWED